VGTFSKQDWGDHTSAVKADLPRRNRRDHLRRSPSRPARRRQPRRVPPQRLAQGSSDHPPRRPLHQRHRPRLARHPRPRCRRPYYYGDNREPGRDLHGAHRGGNRILRDAFAAAQQGPSGRATVPPFLLFEKAGPIGRAVRFRRLLAPGTPYSHPDTHLTTVWRSRGGERYQNYRALFTVLDAATVRRSWLTRVLAGPGGASAGPGAPAAGQSWVASGAYMPLLAPPVTQHRTRAAQTPATAGEAALLDTLWKHFRDRPTDFEPCAGELFRLSAPAVDSLEVTRPSRDGGRDATGHYAIGPATDRIRLEFALEAKCYDPGNAVRAADVARLLSRLKHRRFGVLVTTSKWAHRATGRFATTSTPSSSSPATTSSTSSTPQGSPHLPRLAPGSPSATPRHQAPEHASHPAACRSGASVACRK